jgi:hypothetical protein
MNAKRFLLFLAASFATTDCPATNVGLGTIEQPVNLGAESDPARIPLGAVATESNYSYGRGPVITAPRPSMHGAMEWKSGSELDQNLASVFGIEVDNHDLPHSPATIHLKARPAPPYSPYTKDQVLAATIHCLLRSNSGRPKSPIQLKFTVDSPDDQPLAEKYGKDYINAPDNFDDPPVEATTVPGTKLETDRLGITWVVFPEVKSTAAKPPRRPVMIPFRLGGESGPEDPTWQLLPVWTGTSFTREQSLEILGRPYPLFYDCFQPGNGVVQDSNALFSSEPRGSIYQFEVTATGESTDARLVYPDTSGETLAATILALVVSSQPTEDRPLNVTLITQNDSPPAWFESFKTCPEWETAHSQGSKVTLTCSFAWDPETAALSQGAVPSAEIVRTTNGAIFIEVPSKPVERKPPAEEPPPMPDEPTPDE